MDLQVDHDAAVPTLRVAGDMDADTAYDVYLAVLEQGGGASGTVVLDLSGVEFIDSVGLGMLVRSRDELADQGSRLQLRDPSPRVCRMLELTALAGAFDVADGP